MTTIKQAWHERPGAVLAVVQAGLVAAVTFGVELTREQTGAVLLLACAVLGVLSGRTVTTADVDPALTVDPATVLSTTDLWPDDEPDVDDVAGDAPEELR